MQDITHAHRRRRDLIIAAVLIAVAACVPMFVKDVYIQNIMVLTLMYAALSQSWNILGGYCGQISLGHALYFGIGAYTTAILFTKFGVLPWFGMLIGGVAPAAIALAPGYPTFRLGGHYFAIATIVIAEIAFLLFLNWDWAGAALGIDLGRSVMVGVVPSGPRGVNHGSVLVTGSSSDSRPRSAIRRAAVATIGLVTEARRKIAFCCIGRPASRSASPAARS